jgi:hypothetical protein
MALTMASPPSQDEDTLPEVGDNSETESISSFARFARDCSEGGKALYVDKNTGLLTNADLSKEDAVIIQHLKEFYQTLCLECGEEKALKMGGFLRSNKVKALLLDAFGKVTSPLSPFHPSHTHTPFQPLSSLLPQGKVSDKVEQMLVKGKRTADTERLQKEVHTHTHVLSHTQLPLRKPC